MKYFYLCVLGCFIANALPTSHAGVQDVQEWQGELFSKKQGALLFKLDYSDRISDELASPIEFRLVNLINKKQFRIAVEPFSAFAAHTELLFKIPSGKYLLKSIRFQTTDGRRLTWKGSKKKPIQLYVMRQVISNAGVWRLKFSKRNRLTLSIRKFDVTKERNWLLKFKETAAAVIDAKSKLVQMHLGGKKIQRQAATLVTDDTDAMGVVSYQRTIGFYYQVDLLRNNRHASSFINTLSLHDSTLRKCYTDGLDEGHFSKGKIVFSILYSGKKRSIVKLQKSAGSTKLDGTAKCLYEKMQDIKFAVNQTMAGRVTFTMNYQN